MEISSLYNKFLQCSSVTTDSRNCPKDSMFIALKGDNFNGNAFASKALESGCLFAVVDEKEYFEANDERYILVDSCLSALQELAKHRYNRNQWQNHNQGIDGCCTDTSL